MRRLILLLTFGLHLIAGAVETISPAPELVQAMKKLGPTLQVQSWFKGPGNLTGVAARYNGQPMVFFTDPKAEFMLTGAAVQLASGRNLIADATLHFFSKPTDGGTSALALPNALKSSVSMQSLSTVGYIRQGLARSGRVAHIFFDFGCGHCIALYGAIAREKINGEIRWVPIALSGELATTKAALALGLGRIDSVISLDAKALTSKIASHKEEFGRGALIVERNSSIAQGLNIEATPHFIFERNGALFEQAGFGTAINLLAELGVL